MKNLVSKTSALERYAHEVLMEHALWLLQDSLKLQPKNVRERF